MPNGPVGMMCHIEANADDGTVGTTGRRNVLAFVIDFSDQPLCYYA